MYTRIDALAFRIIVGNWNVGVPSAISVSVHPSISAPEPPVFVISTYSSDSEVGTTPSKNMQAIMREAGGAVSVQGLVSGSESASPLESPRVVQAPSLEWLWEEEAGQLRLVDWASMLQWAAPVSRWGLEPL